MIWFNITVRSADLTKKSNEKESSMSKSRRNSTFDGIFLMSDSITWTQFWKSLFSTVRFVKLFHSVTATCTYKHKCYFIQGCQKKIETTTASFRSTQSIIDDQNREIRKLNKELQKLKQVKKELEERRNLCESLKYYLDDVVSKQNEHESIEELIARYEDLKRIRHETWTRTLEGLAKRLDTLLKQNDDSEVWDFYFNLVLWSCQILVNWFYPCFCIMYSERHYRDNSVLKS